MLSILLSLLPFPARNVKSENWNEVFDGRWERRRRIRIFWPSFGTLSSSSASSSSFPTVSTTISSAHPTLSASMEWMGSSWDMTPRPPSQNLRWPPESLGSSTLLGRLYPSRASSHKKINSVLSTSTNSKFLIRQPAALILNNILIKWFRILTLI